LPRTSSRLRRGPGRPHRTSPRLNRCRRRSGRR
jgi:hypothetical protein